MPGRKKSITGHIGFTNTPDYLVVGMTIHSLFRVLTQKKDDSNKVYSVHEPEVLCISKGNEHFR